MTWEGECTGGEILALRYDHTVPLARYVALNNVAATKRYTIGRSYRRDQPQANKGRFREFYQADYDIVGGKYAPMAADAEVLKVGTATTDLLAFFQSQGTLYLQTTGLPVCMHVRTSGIRCWPQVPDAHGAENRALSCKVTSTSESQHSLMSSML